MPRPMSRRQFLVSSGVVGATALAAGATGCSFHHLVAAGKQTPLPQGTKILVLVTLYGGNDGLNTVIPYTDKAYYAGRPDLAYEQSQVLPLADGLGFNPAMTGFKKLYDAGTLAVVRGVGYPNADRSHFKSMAIWQTASPDSPQPTGWLGRWLDANGADPLLAVNVGPVLPPLLAGQHCAGAGIPSSGSIALARRSLREWLAGIGRGRAGRAAARCAGGPVGARPLPGAADLRAGAGRGALGRPVAGDASTWRLHSLHRRAR